MQLFRSLLFNVAFYLNTFLQIMFYLPVLLLPRRYVWIRCARGLRATAFS